MTEKRLHLWPLLTMLLFGAVAVDAAAPSEPTDDLDVLIASLEGGWAGEDNVTPLGEMAFATLFEWEEDGSLHSRSALNRETYIDLRFWQDAEGRWNLREEAGMEGLGVQSYDLVPAGKTAERGLHRWVYAEDPGFLAVDVGVEEETMILDVTLRGEPHVAFRLDKQPAELWPEMKRQMLLQASQSPEEGYSIADVMAEPPGAAIDAAAEPDPGDPIALARREVAEDPADAGARLALAKILGAAIDEDPANGPRYAFEMLGSLEKAVELDPDLVEAYHWLVGYYLSAPPIAGGSVAKAAEVAARLAELDPEGAEPLLEQIAARSGESDVASGEDSP